MKRVFIFILFVFVMLIGTCPVQAKEYYTDDIFRVKALNEGDVLIFPEDLEF